MLPLTLFACFIPFLFPPWAQHSLMAPPSSSPVPQLRPMLPSGGRAAGGAFGVCIAPLAAGTRGFLQDQLCCRSGTLPKFPARRPGPACSPQPPPAQMPFQSLSKQSYCSYCLQKRALNHPLSPAPGAGCSEVARHSLWDSFYTAAQVSDPAACPLGVFIACRGDFSLCQILVTCGYQAPRSALVILSNRTLPGKHIS